MDAMTVPASLAGLPALTLPNGMNELRIINITTRGRLGGLVHLPGIDCKKTACCGHANDAVYGKMWLSPYA
eukprot:4757176-Pyramimonas_sp.AAC.1